MTIINDQIFWLIQKHLFLVHPSSFGGNVFYIYIKKKQSRITSYKYLQHHIKI